VSEPARAVLGRPLKTATPWRRAVASAALLCLLLAPRGAAGEAPQDPKPPPQKEIGDLARKYATVAEWEGSFDASETGSVSWNSAGGANSGSSHVNRTSTGRFRIARNTSQGWEPERGMFHWGDSTREVSGEAGAAEAIESSEWSKYGQGYEWRDRVSGEVPLTGSEFEIWLGAKEAWVRVGNARDTLAYERVGRSVTDESRGDGQVHLKTTPIRKSDRVEGFLPPLSTNIWNSAASYRVASGGPGVLTFSCEGSWRADTRPSTPEITHRSRVTLIPIYDDLEVQVTIDGYEKWLPSGSVEDPSAAGSHFLASAVLVSRTGKIPPPAKSFQFELLDVSREPGVCMNWPRLGAGGDHPPAEDPAPDLRFAAGSGTILTKEHLAAEVRPTRNPVGRDSAAVRVDSYDFGGTATLRVRCVLDDQREIFGQLQTPAGRLLSIPIPFRRGGSRVADFWKKLRKVDGADADDLDDDPVGDGNRGDGFSTFEEYRGFVVNRGHLRTKPGRKDLFVSNRIGDKALAGLEKLSSLTKLEVHHDLRRDEMPVSRRMNVNRSAGSPRTSGEYQHGVILKIVKGGVYSKAIIPVGLIGRPKVTDHVEILGSLFAPGNEDEVSAVIAHELLHSIGVLHHGDTDIRYVEWSRKARTISGVEEAWYEERRIEPVKGGWRYVGSAYPIRLLDGDGNEYRAQDDPVYLVDPKKGYVGCFGGEHSGDVDCVMRYRCAAAFRPGLGPQFDRLKVPEAEPRGWKLCTSEVGTDFNGPNRRFIRYGNAKRGNCEKRFCVRDDAPAPKAP